MGLGSTQPLTEMSTRNISWGIKAAGAYGWQPYHLHVPNVLKSGSLNLLEPSGPVQACNGIALPLLISVTAWVDPTAIVWPGRIKSTKSPNDPIGNRTRDLPVYGAVPQTAAPLRTETLNVTLYIVTFKVTIHVSFLELRANARCWELWPVPPMFMHSNHFFIHKQQVTVLVIKQPIRANGRIKWCPLKGTQCVKEQKRYGKLGIHYILLGPLISWVTYGHVGLKEISSPGDKERSHSSYILRHRTLRLRYVSPQSKSVLCTTSRRLSDMTDVIHLTLRRLMSYIYGAPILDVSRSHRTTQHSR